MSYARYAPTFRSSKYDHRFTQPFSWKWLAYV